MSENTVNTKAAPFVVKQGEGDRTLSFNLLVRRVASRDETAGEFGLIEMSGVRGIAAPPHAHGTEAEAFFGLEGTVRVWVGDIEHVMHPGDFVYIPKDAPHKFEIESEHARFLCLITPGGFEDFFDALGERTEDAYPPNPRSFGPFPTMEEIDAVAPRFNWSLVQDF
jgi:quercetin 2,3-dioxygenase